jgi:hypothetical protein
MARRLTPWHWIRLVRERGPKVSSVRTVLFALAVRMDKYGEAFPSQELLGKDTALSVRTVRDALLEARRTCWLAVVDHARYGQAWRLSHYIACIPDSLNLAAVKLRLGVDLESMADIVALKHGDVKDRMHGLPRRVRGGGQRGTKGAATKRNEVRQPSLQGAAIDRNNVRQPLPTKSPSKVPIQVPTQEGRIASDAPTCAKDADVRKPKSGTQSHPKVATLSGSDPIATPSEVLHEAGKPEPKPNLSGHIRQLLQAGQVPGDVQKILGGRGCTIEDVLAVQSGRETS